MFRFTIRDVLWLTALVALGLVWMLERQWLAVQNHRLRERVDHRESLLDNYLPSWRQMTFPTTPPTTP